MKRKLKFNKKTVAPQTQGQRPKTVLMYPAGIHDGCTAWRFDWVRTAMNYNRIAQVQMTNMVQPLFVDHKGGGKQISPIYVQTDAVVIQRPTQDVQIQTAKHFQYAKEKIKEAGKEPFRFIVDIDDVVHGDHISKFNAARAGYADGKRFEVFKDVVRRSDELHVCSPSMADYYKNELEFENVLYRPNLLPKHLFDGYYDLDVQYKRYEKHKKKPRIIWAGSATHVDVHNLNNGLDDFSHIENFVKKTVDDYQWVFLGAAPKWITPEHQAGKVEVYSWVAIQDYPQRLWDLEPNIVIAPLFDDIFNRCKSNIKLTESGAMGIAGVFQNLDPYAEAPLKFDNADELSDHIKYLLKDWDNYVKVVKEMRKYSEGFFMENNFNLLRAAYFTSQDSKERRLLSKKLIEIQ